MPGQDYAAPAQLSSPNLLHNWDFRYGRGIDQRTLSCYFEHTIPTGSHYIVDRWYAVNALAGGATAACQLFPTYNSSANRGLQIKMDKLTSGAANDFQLRQRLEGRLVAGQTYTLSLLAWGSYGVQIGVDLGGQGGAITMNPTGDNTQPDLYTFTATMDQDYTGAIAIISGVTPHGTATMAHFNIHAVKLERGNVSTLLSDPLADHTVELLKCQRYLMSFGNAKSLEDNSLLLEGSCSGCQIECVLTLPVAMRAVPTFSYGGSSYVIGVDTDTSVYLEDEPEAVYVASNGAFTGRLRVRVSYPPSLSSSLPEKKTYRIYMRDVLLSAEQF